MIELIKYNLNLLYKKVKEQAKLWSIQIALLIGGYQVYWEILKPDLPTEWQTYGTILMTVALIIARGIPQKNTE